jgi:hypothetical protein
VLKSRDDVLQKLLVEAQQQLAKIGQSPQYPDILHKLILQVCANQIILGGRGVKRERKEEKGSGEREGEKSERERKS